jgi:hypothetical protein
MKHMHTAAKAALMSAWLFSAEAMAQSGGVSPATNFLTTVKGWLMIVIPIIAMMLGVVLWIMYAKTDLIRKEHLYKWGVGLVGVTIVSPLVGLAFSLAG